MTAARPPRLVHASWRCPKRTTVRPRRWCKVVSHPAPSGEIVGFGIDGTWKPVTDFERDKAPKGDKNGAGKMDPTERAALDALVARPPLPCSAGRGTRARCAWGNRGCAERCASTVPRRRSGGSDAPYFAGELPHPIRCPVVAAIGAGGRSWQDPDPAPRSMSPSMRPGANRRDHNATLAGKHRHTTGFNEARRESPGSQDR